MKMNLNIFHSNLVSFIKGVFTIFNKTSTFLIFILFSFLMLFNSEIFSQSSVQAEQLRNSIVYLLLFVIISLFIAYLKNPESVKRELFKAKGLIGILSFVFSFLFFGLLFVSFEGTLNTNFVTGLLANTSYLFFYMLIVATSEELIFRVALVDILKEKTKNIYAVYFVAALIFVFYHYYKYEGSIFSLFFAFISGLFFTFLKERENLFVFSTLPMAVALHLTYNLYTIGALNITLSMVGLN